MKTGIKMAVAQRKSEPDEMAGFSDLSDQIGADDWLIASKEIGRRRLIKRTACYNIYKADWFGDVLVYEPIQAEPAKSTQLAARRRQQDCARCRRASQRQQQLLASELSELNLNLSVAHQQERLNNREAHTFESEFDAEEHTDSAYSSVSSTPQYNTKNLNNEFEFPSGSARTPDSLNSRSSQAGSLSEQGDNFVANTSLGFTSETRQTLRDTGYTKQAMILNKDSFTFAREQGKLQSEDRIAQSSCWSELNELRLIAHESFMLFMGASVPADETSTWLVMQMSHPGAISLFELLHCNKVAPSSPIDRFFHSKRHFLDLEAKLSICQQVTNAITYLHDKNIVHGKLTSVNIYLEPNQRVKISLLDNDDRPIASPGNQQGINMTTDLNNQNKPRAFVQFNLTSLTYLSPELIKSICVLDPETTDGDHTCLNCHNAHVSIDRSQLTKKADIFALGTLIFELFHERFPFGYISNLGLSGKPSLDSPIFYRTSSPSYLRPPTDIAMHRWNGNIKLSALELIYQIGSGKIGTKNLNRNSATKIPSLVEHIISKCWALEPTKRPQSKQLVSMLFIKHHLC